MIPFLSSNYVFAFALINLLTAISNLLLIKGYDGYRIVSGIISVRASADTAANVMESLSLTFSAIAVFISLFLMMRIGEGYWLFAIFFTVLLKEAFKTQKTMKNENN